MLLDPLLNYIRGQAVTIPPMDGALKPNTALEDAEALINVEAPDNLAVIGGALAYTSGAELLSAAKVIARFDAPVTALATRADLRAVGLDSGRIEIQGGAAQTLDGFSCPVALCFGGPDELYVCNGSAEHRPSDWVHDLMAKHASGSVWHVSLKTGEQRCLADGLAFPYGVALDPSGQRLIVAESWRHRLVSLALAGGSAKPLLSKLPGYPARLTQRPGGGYLLCLFAPRNRLIEFVLGEDAYRADMIAELDPRYWIAPSLSASRSFLEPLQNGGVVSMGIHKPWSPSRSYGLVVELDAALQPVASHHSRANGKRHGITSAIDHAGRIIAASKGGDAVLGLQGSPAQ